MIIRGVYDTVGAPEGQPSPLTSSDIKQMLAVMSEAGWSSSLPPAIRSCAGGTDAGMEREEEAEGGRWWEGGGRHMEDPCAPSCLSQLMTRLRGAVVREQGN